MSYKNWAYASLTKQKFGKVKVNNSREDIKKIETRTVQALLELEVGQKHMLVFTEREKQLWKEPNKPNHGWYGYPSNKKLASASCQSLVAQARKKGGFFTTKTSPFGLIVTRTDKDPETLRWYRNSLKIFPLIEGEKEGSLNPDMEAKRMAFVEGAKVAFVKGKEYQRNSGLW